MLIALVLRCCQPPAGWLWDEYTPMHHMETANARDGYQVSEWILSLSLGCAERHGKTQHTPWPT